MNQWLWRFKMKLTVEDFNRYINKDFMLRPDGLVTTFDSTLVAVNEINGKIMLDVKLKGIGVQEVTASKKILDDMKRANR